MTSTYTSLYEFTGDIKDLNTLFVNRNEIEALVLENEALRFALSQLK